MSATGLDVFDKTVQSMNIWVNEVCEEIGPDKQRGYHALRAVLFVLRDELPVGEAFHLSAQMPMLIRGIYWDGYKPAGKPKKSRSRDEFLEEVGERLKGVPPMNTEVCTKAVFSVLDQHVTGGELSEIRHNLSQDIRVMFPSR